MSEDAPEQRWPDWLTALLVLVAATLVAAPSIPGQFVWDDVILIEHNAALDELGSGWRSAWGDFFQQGDSGRSVSGFFRPVPTILNTLTVAAFGKSALAFHLGNLGIHLFTCLLGLALLRRLGWSAIGAAAGVALYALHPMQSESIAYISCRPDLCAAAGTVLALYAYDRYRMDGWTWGLPVALFAYLLALLSKEVAVGAILIIALLERSRYDDRRWPLLGVMALPLVIYGVCRLTLLTSAAHGRFDLTDQPVVALSLIGFYLSRVLWPSDPRAIYEHLTPQDSGLMTAVGIVALGALIWSLNRSDRQKHPPLLGLLWFLIFIGPVLHLVPFGTVAAERYLYLPLMGISASAGWIVSRGLDGDYGLRRATLALSISLLLILGVSTALRTGAWRTELTLWGEELSREPVHHSVYANLGTALMDEGRAPEAHAAYLKAWSASPGHGHTFRNLMRIESVQLPVSLRREFRSAALRPNVEADALLSWEKRLTTLGFPEMAVKVKQRAIVLQKRAKFRPPNSAP